MQGEEAMNPHPLDATVKLLRAEVRLMERERDARESERDEARASLRAAEADNAVLRGIVDRYAYQDGFEKRTSNGLYRDARDALSSAHPGSALLEAVKMAHGALYNPDENATERFDRLADLFHRETGCTRPGRSTPLAMGSRNMEADRATWDKWCDDRARKVVAAVLPWVGAK